jgi:Cu+-exporting ATPase
VWAELALTTPVLFWAGREFFTGAWISARHRAADMNTLIAVGTLAAYAYSLVATVAPQLLMPANHSGHAGNGHGMEGPGVYYEVAAMVVTLILMGNVLQARANSQTSGAIKALMGLQPKNGSGGTRWKRAGYSHLCRAYRRHGAGAARRKSSGRWRSGRWHFDG